MKYLIFFLFAILIIPTVYALEGSMPLLAVRESDEGMQGSTAELFLEIEKGSGRVFVDTFPLSKLDTQISMRIAKEIACDSLSYDCDKLDFIYTIRANSPIIGGPSAGGAATILTMAVLSEEELFDNISLTGTINSGGLIGAVGGIKEKISAGVGIGLKTILIPMGENISTNNTGNTSIGVIEYGGKLNVTIIEVTDVYSAFELFTGKQIIDRNSVISVSPVYEETMEQLAAQLCERNDELKNLVLEGENIKDLKELAINLSIQGNVALSAKEFYSAASYCFGSNVRFNQAFLYTKNFTEEKYSGLMRELLIEIITFENSFENKSIKTITDLESYMVVKERLDEAKQYTNVTSNFEYAYAYANERLRSAHSWAQFFRHQGKSLNLDDKSLKESCQKRISEAEERLQYLALFTPLELNGPREDLKRAYEDFASQEYPLCLFKASIAKAEANIVLTVIGVEPSFIPQLIDNKLDAASRVIQKAGSKDIFPVLGYSYYEYAHNLKENDLMSSLLYAEYALELSNLDVYFKEESLDLSVIDYSRMQWIFIGIIIGVLGTFILTKKGKPSKARASLGKKR